MSDVMGINVNGPALIYIGTDGSRVILDRYNWQESAASVKQENGREHAIMLALIRYALKRAEAVET